MAAPSVPRPSTRGSSVTRVLPFGSRHSVHILERNRFIFRRGWMVIFSGFFEPVFFLLGIGFGLGALIGTVTGPDGTQIPYAVFVAPALLAAASMNGAVYDSTNMFFRLRYEKAYDGMLATPMNVGDIALGEIIWALGRGALYGLGFLAVMFAFGLVPSPLGVLALPASMLIGFATASAGLAATTFMRSWQDLDLLFVITLPLFLFSGTFFPIDTFPEPLRTIVQFSPLYRGVDLVRGLTTGRGRHLAGDRRDLPAGDGLRLLVPRVASPGEDAAQVARGVATSPRGRVRRRGRNGAGGRPGRGSCSRR